MMKRLLQIIQITGFLVSAGLLSITIFWKAEIRELAREFINERIEPKSTMAVDIAEELLRSPKLSEYVSDEQLVVITREIDTYRSDPQAYIRSLTDGPRVAEAGAAGGEDIKNPIIASIVAKVTSWKQSINRYFNEVFERIIQDLRIFASTNIIAFAIAFWLSTRKGMIDVIPYWIASVTLTGSIVYCSMMYVDQNWFFTILLDSFMGVAYPLSIAILFGYIIYRYSQLRGNLNSNKPMNSTAETAPSS